MNATASQLSQLQASLRHAYGAVLVIDSPRKMEFVYAISKSTAASLRAGATGYDPVTKFYRLTLTFHGVTVNCFLCPALPGTAEEKAGPFVLHTFRWPEEKRSSQTPALPSGVRFTVSSPLDDRQGQHVVLLGNLGAGVALVHPVTGPDAIWRIHEDSLTAGWHPLA